MKFHGEDTLQFHDACYACPDTDSSDTELQATEAVNKLTGTTQKIAQALLEGYSIKQASKLFLLPETTVRRMLRDAGNKIKAQQTAR